MSRAGAGGDVERFRLAAGSEVECACWRAAPPESPQPPGPALLLLHEGLGSVAMWGRFPAKLAAASGRTVIAYSRPGYGQSAPTAAPRQADYLHREAWQVLPEVIAALHREARLGDVPPLLVGHSDGASIALLFAARFAESTAGVVVMAPHLWVEAETLAGIREAAERWRNSDWPVRLGRYQATPERVFRDWHDTWLSGEFAAWNIEAEVAKITGPVLAIQGRQDNYATLRQIERIAELASAAAVTLLPLDDCGHSPQNDQPAAVIAAINDFAAPSSLAFATTDAG